MKDIPSEKDIIRKEIASLKSRLSTEESNTRSEEVFATLEATDVFQKAKNIFIYYSLDDEVQTIDFITKWAAHKNFYLPVIVNNDLVFRLFFPAVKLNSASLGIFEPEGNDFTDYRKVDLIIIPGVAFDRKMNRLGRGKGYYDRFLSKISAPKAGICFDFQLIDSLPYENHDIKMNYIISENEILWL